MVKKTLEVFECDVCGSEAERYTINYLDGTLVMDRCDKHNKKQEGLRQEKGQWVTPRGPKATFRKSSVDDLKMALKGRSDGNDSHRD